MDQMVNCRAPKISIVTVVRNDINGMINTFESIMNQSFIDCEYIVIDGCSTDGTLEYLKSKSNLITRIISEKDNGIYDAMNKGASIASGDWLLYLNAGDILYSPKTLAKVAARLKNSNTLYFGRANVEETNGYNWSYPPICVDEKNYRFWLYNNLPNHQAMFFPKKYYQTKKYRLDLVISSDSEYKESAFSILPSNFMDISVVHFRLNGISAQIEWRPLLQQLKDRYVRHSNEKVIYDFPISLAKTIVKLFMRKLFGSKSRPILVYLKSRVDCFRVLTLSLLTP